MHLQILTPDKAVFDGEVQGLLVPGAGVGIGRPKDIRRVVRQDEGGGVLQHRRPRQHGQTDHGQSGDRERDAGPWYVQSQS